MGLPSNSKQSNLLHSFLWIWGSKRRYFRSQIRFRSGKVASSWRSQGLQIGETIFWDQKKNYNLVANDRWLVRPVIGWRPLPTFFVCIVLEPRRAQPTLDTIPYRLYNFDCFVILFWNTACCSSCTQDQTRWNSEVYFVKTSSTGPNVGPQVWSGRNRSPFSTSTTALASNLSCRDGNAIWVVNEKYFPADPPNRTQRPSRA